MVTRDGGDYIASGLVKYWAERYAGPNSLSDPWISPALFPEDVLRAALPKQTLVTAGTHEIIVDDIDVLVKKLGDKGVSYVKGQDRVHDYVTLDVTFGLGSFDKAGREIGVEQLAKFLAA
jgi:acetyl esterase/lipase